ncbi:putative single-stranded DNA-binding protein [Achromobacter phage JWDelta]|uniref:Putative single-stranded DNA-binding protein n=1 Tax=Achromobacter phage JWDelta TaxID=1416008 RepID=V9SKB0_9CAUD|nr:putative single-stranded DNA-binding protein [Achromobacter phage JWDelta]
MSTLFGNLKEKTQNMEAARDSVGGGGFVIDADAYEMTLKVAYVGQSKGGANFMSLIFDRDGTDYREDVYFTSSKEKGQLPYYVKNDKQFPLPGYSIVSDLCLILGGTSLEDTEFEEKTVNVYDFDAKKELPKSVMVPVELLGKKIIVGVQRTTENKQVKDASGNYVNSGETRDVNNIDKLFDLESKMTVLEALNQAEKPVFYDTWIEANKGKVRDNTKKGDKAAPTQGTAGAPPKAAAAPAAGGARPSLFGKK